MNDHMKRQMVKGELPKAIEDEMDLKATGPCKVCNGQACYGVAFIPSLSEHKKIFDHYNSLGWRIPAALNNFLKEAEQFKVSGYIALDTLTPAFITSGGICKECFDHRAVEFSDAMLFDLMSSPHDSVITLASKDRGLH